MRTRSIVSVAVFGFLLSLAVTSQVNKAFAQGGGTVKSCTNTSGAAQNYSYDAACVGGSTNAGTTVVSSSTAVAAANATAGLVLNRVSSFRASAAAPGKTASGGGTINLLGFGSGAAAGEKSDSAKFGLWVNGARTRVVGTATGADFDTIGNSGMIGLDVRPVKEFMIGIAAGYEKTDGDTGFNRGSVDSKGRTGALYMGINLSDQVSIDAVAGYTDLSYDLDRLDPLSNTLIAASDVDAKRIFGSINLVGTFELSEDVDFGIKIGTMYVDEDQDGFTEFGGANAVVVGSSTTTVGTANAGLRLSGSHKYVRPYLEGTFGYDYKDEAGSAYSDDHSYGGAAGIDISLGDTGASLNVEGRGVFKDELKTGTGSATLRFQQNF